MEGVFSSSESLPRHPEREYVQAYVYIYILYDMATPAGRRYRACVRESARIRREVEGALQEAAVLDQTGSKTKGRSRSGAF